MSSHQERVINRCRYGEADEKEYELDSVHVEEVFKIQDRAGNRMIFVKASNLFEVGVSADLYQYSRT